MQPAEAGESTSGAGVIVGLGDIGIGGEALGVEAAAVGAGVALRGVRVGVRVGVMVGVEITVAVGSTTVGGIGQLAAVGASPCV